MIFLKSNYRRYEEVSVPGTHCEGGDAPYVPLAALDKVGAQIRQIFAEYDPAFTSCSLDEVLAIAAPTARTPALSGPQDARVRFLASRPRWM